MQTFCSKNDKKDQNRYSSVAAYTLPIAIAAMSVLASATGCDKGDVFEHEPEPKEIPDSLNREEPPFDIIVDTTYNDIIEDVIVFGN
jgi:hypothetical protein